MVAPVSPGSGAVSNFGMRLPGASASSHSTARAVNQAANRQASARTPGPIGTRRRRRRATTSRTVTTNGTSSIASVIWASQPRSTFPERKSPGSPPVSIVAAELSSETTFATVVPTRPSCAASRPRSGTASPAFPAVSVIAGMSREISGPCSWGVYGMAYPESWS